ncbi:MAG: hypothetical protein ACFE8N_14420, partial [Promethearchaeota archaeon]
MTIGKRNKMIRRLFLVFSLPALLLGNFNPDSIIKRIEHIKEGKKGHRYLCRIDGIFDENENLWLTWRESDKRKISMYERFIRESKGERVPYEDLFSYQYIQKFNKNGVPIFPPVELSKYRPINGGGIGISRFYLGNSNDIYILAGANFRIFRVDNKGNLYKSGRSYKNNVLLGDMFIDSNGIMHVFSAAIWGSIKTYSKFKVQSQLPVLLEERDLTVYEPAEKGGKIGKPEYKWIRNNLKYYDPNGKYTLCVNWANDFIKPSRRLEPWVDSTRLYISKVRWSDLCLIDSFSFRISDALHKKILGCKLKLKQ